MATSFGGTIKLQGESEYRKALKDISSNLKLMSSELKLTNTEFSNGDKSVKQTKTSYDNMSKTLQEQRSKVNDLRDALSKAEKEYGSNNEKVKTFKTQLNNAETQLRQMEDATDKSTKELKDMKKGFDDAGGGALKFGDILKANVLSDVIVGGLKKLGSAVVDVGKAFINVGKQAIESYAEFEQLEGGVKKLFGDDMAKSVISNANNAFKTSGMSANDYIDTVTSFSASLIGSLGGDTEKATGYADRAIQDMADNANTFGTDMQSIQNAYQGFAKGNYTMLDNLKLGFAGSKEGMQSLLDKAGEISGKKFDISSFADITEAIHIMQQEMNIAGTTSKEAGTTIEGSVNSMKSAWQNLLTGLAGDGENLGQLIDNLMQSIFGDGSDTNLGVFGNVMPVIERVISSFSTMIPTIVGRLAEHLPELLQIGIDMLQNLMDGISSMIPQLLPVIVDLVGQLAQFITQNLPTVINAGIQILLAIVQGIGESLPQLIPALVDAVILIVETLIDNIDMIIDAGIQLIIGLAEGLIEALPRLIEKIPVIIDKLINAIVNNLPKILKMGITLIVELGKGLIQAIPQLIANVPKIISSLVKGLKDGLNSIKNVGKEMINGLWGGIKEKWEGLKDGVKKFGEGIVGKFKSVFGINSPSRVFKEQIGTNLALGIEEGFSDTMSNVSKEMANSIPTEFDTNINANYRTSASSSISTYDNMVNAFKEALKDVKVVMNDREMGTFVTDTMERVIYT